MPSSYEHQLFSPEQRIYKKPFRKTQSLSKLQDEQIIQGNKNEENSKEQRGGKYVWPENQAGSVQEKPTQLSGQHFCFMVHNFVRYSSI